MANSYREFVQVEADLSTDDTDGEETSYIHKTRRKMAIILRIKSQEMVPEVSIKLSLHSFKSE